MIKPLLQYTGLIFLGLCIFYTIVYIINKLISNYDEENTIYHADAGPVCGSTHRFARRREHSSSIGSEVCAGQRLQKGGQS